jgi:hypothetical protein
MAVYTFGSNPPGVTTSRAFPKFESYAAFDTIRSL